MYGKQKQLKLRQTLPFNLLIIIYSLGQRNPIKKQKDFINVIIQHFQQINWVYFYKYNFVNIFVILQCNLYILIEIIVIHFCGEFMTIIILLSHCNNLIRNGYSIKLFACRFKYFVYTFKNNMKTMYIVCCVRFQQVYPPNRQSNKAMCCICIAHIIQCSHS